MLAGDTVYADGARLLREYRGVWSDALKTKGLRGRHLRDDDDSDETACLSVQAWSTR